MVAGDWETDWDNSPWKGTPPTEDQRRVYSDLVSMEPTHAGLRNGETFVEELGYICKRAGGMAAVLALIQRIRTVKDKELGGLEAVLNSWATDACKGNPTAT